MDEIEYAAPGSLDEALALLARRRGEARVLAGGQSLVPIMNLGLLSSRLIVDINDLPLTSLTVGRDRLSLGSLTRHCSLEESPVVAGACALLTEAVRLVGNVRVRSLGTLGGSLAHADPAAELPLAAVTLDAVLTLRSVRGERRVGAGEFFTGYLSTALEPDELLTAVDVPTTAGHGVALEEVARRAGDFALVAVAAVVRVDGRGRVASVRLGAGGVGAVPVRARDAEDALVGHEPTADRLRQVAGLLADGLEPTGDPFASAAYRRHLARVLGRRALARAVTRALEAA